MSGIDEGTLRRVRQLCDMTHAMLESTSPPKRDRWLQEALAQAASPAENARALCVMTAFVLGINAQRNDAEGSA